MLASIFGQINHLRSTIFSHVSSELVNSSNDDVWLQSASCKCSHGKQVAGSSHANSSEFSEGESGASLCLPPSQCYQVWPTPANLVP